MEFIRVSHSIPDGVAIAAHTPAGLVVHSGDFKFDDTPVDGEVTDVRRFAELGDAESWCCCPTAPMPPARVRPPRNPPSARHSSRSSGAPRRLIVACFASNIHRIQQVLDVAARLGKKVAVNGKSMAANIRIAGELGYLRVPQDTLVRLDEFHRVPPDQGVIITTGSQGEPLSAVARMAVGEHKQIEVEPGDTVIFSARVIPGNEQSIARTVNQLLQRGRQVITEDVRPGVHVSGHPSREELKLMSSLTRPRFFVPVHGEYRHLHWHADLARQMGMPADTGVPAGGRGRAGADCATSGQVTGRVPAGRVLVDGKGVGDVGITVLRDRQHLAQDGMVVVVVGLDGAGTVVVGPDIISRVSPICPRGTPCSTGPAS